MEHSTMTSAFASPPVPARPRVAVPGGMCDTHAHVFDPVRFPYAPSRRYTPPAATAAALRHVMAQLGAARVVLVQPSCYGLDNTALMDALGTLGATQARGVVVIDAAHTSAAALADMHRRGARGVRINVSVDDPGDRHVLLRRMTDVQTATGPLGWHLQLFADARTVVALADELAAMTMPVVLDHFGGLDDAALAADTGAVESLADLLRHGHIHIKLSAPYRVTRDPSAAGLAKAVRRFAEVAPDRLLWASDWPHTGGAGPRNGDATGIEAFRDENAALALERLYSWIPDTATRHRILVSNPARLYGFDEPSFVPFNTTRGTHD